jgi:AraC-like DNA-binding protein
MRLSYCVPDRRLRFVIDRFWGWEAAPGERPVLLPALPGPGGLEIFFHYHDGFVRTDTLSTLPRDQVLCLRSAPVPLEPAGRIGFIAVRIRAGMAERITPVPVAEIADRTISAEEIWGTAARQLLDMLTTGSSFEERVAILNRFFLARLRARRGNISIDRALLTLEHCTDEISRIARDNGLSVRQLEKRFLAATGVTPARFRRLARLRRSVKALLLNPPSKLLSSQVDPGYFDQPQQVREFREFTHFTPGELRRLAAHHLHFYSRSRDLGVVDEASGRCLDGKRMLRSAMKQAPRKSSSAALRTEER